MSCRCLSFLLVALLAPALAAAERNYSSLEQAAANAAHEFEKDRGEWRLTFQRLHDADPVRDPERYLEVVDEAATGIVSIARRIAESGRRVGVQLRLRGDPAGVKFEVEAAELRGQCSGLHLAWIETVTERLEDGSWSHEQLVATSQALLELLRTTSGRAHYFYKQFMHRARAVLAKQPG